MANNWNYVDSYFDGNSYKTRAQAFATARKNGSGIFTYKGKQYNTMQKGENADEFRRAHADYNYFLGNVANNQEGWKLSDPVQTSYKVNNVPDVYTGPLPKSSMPQTPARTKLSMFTNDDIRNLGFKNYSGMVSAVGNQANANNNFVKAIINRYGSDTSKWNQDTIENDLGVKGTYRNFGGGEMDDKKSKLVKKPQSKPGMVKPTNKRPGPRDLKTLPNGKYPKYWTANQRGQWDRDHNEGD